MWQLRTACLPRNVAGVYNIKLQRYYSVRSREKIDDDKFILLSRLIYLLL